MPEKRRSLSEALNTNVRRYGTTIVSDLAIAVKTTQLYSFEHQNVVEALRELREILKSFIELEQEAELSRVDDFLFINEIRIKLDFGGMKTYESVLKILKEREIGSIRFSQVPGEAELRRLVDLLSAPVGDTSQPWLWFESTLRSAELPSIRISKHEAPKDEALEEDQDPRTLAIKIFFRAVEEMREVFDAANKGRKINFRRLKRIVQLMVDLLAEERPTLLAVVNIKAHGSRLANHLVNVAILSMALGARLGFSKKLLGDLGIAAILHDLGFLGLAPELAAKESRELGEDERKALEEHPYKVVDLLIHQRISDAVVKSMNVGFLHHFRYDGTGYPRTYAVKGQNLYSRIVAVADFYDNRTASGPDGERALRPEEAMRKLLEGSGTEFDPLVVKAFVNTMGLYPVGSLVRLDTGELATVIAPARDPRHLDRPTVRLFADSSGNPADGIVDLSERTGGEFRRSILKLYQESEVGLRLEEYLCVI